MEYDENNRDASDPRGCCQLRGGEQVDGGPRAGAEAQVGGFPGRGDQVTGATTFRIVKELDAGPTFGVVTETVRPTDTAGDLLGRRQVGDLPVHRVDEEGVQRALQPVQDPDRPRRCRDRQAGRSTTASRCLPPCRRALER